MRAARRARRRGNDPLSDGSIVHPQTEAEELAGAPHEQDDCGRQDQPNQKPEKDSEEHERERIVLVQCSTRHIDDRPDQTVRNSSRTHQTICLPTCCSLLLLLEFPRPVFGLTSPLQFPASGLGFPPVAF